MPLVFRTASMVCIGTTRFLQVETWSFLEEINLIPGREKIATDMGDIRTVEVPFCRDTISVDVAFTYVQKYSMHTMVTFNGGPVIYNVKIRI